MKKLIALILSVMMLCCVCGAEEFVADSEYTTDGEGIISFDIVLDKLPEGYTLETFSYMNTLYYDIVNDSVDGAVLYYGSVAHSDEFDNEETGAYTLDLEAMTAGQLEQMQTLCAAGFDSPAFSYDKTAYGTDIIIIVETNCPTGFVDVFTIYNGYFITVSAFVDGELTQDVIDTCVTIMSDLWVVEA